MMTVPAVILGCGFAALFVANAVRAALPRMILDMGRDPAERRRAAVLHLRVLWFARMVALVACGAGVVLTAGRSPLRDLMPPVAGALVLSLLLLLLGELLPSRLGHTSPGRIVSSFRLPFAIMRFLFYIPVRIFLGRLPAGTEGSGEWAFTPPDLMWLEQRHEKGDREDFDQERELLDGIVEFSDKIVREVMVPRIDMACIELSDDFDAVITEVNRVGHSRIPVYRERIDDIAGVLYVKDLLKVPAGGQGFRMDKLLRQAYFVPEYKRIDDLFREFQSHRIHMAVVVDEYGGTAGLVTMEDLVEEVFGEILDEFDDSEGPRVQSMGMGGYRIDAMLPLDDLNDLLDTEFEAGDYETVGGLVYHALGKIPRPGESVALGGFVFTVERVRAQRVILLRVTPETQPPEEPGQ